MPSQPRNMPEQERSIRARSHELFVEPGPSGEETRPTKPFPVYLRETPAQPFSPFTKAVFWVLGIVVTGLFLAAVWRVSHHQRSKAPASRRPAKSVIVHPRATSSVKSLRDSTDPRGESPLTSPTFQKNHPG
jgi:hypothetical protein